eukprot:6366534-Pyramimonas_sp.AAC.1
MAPQTLQEAPRRPQDGSKKPKSFPRMPEIGQNHSNISLARTQPYTVINTVVVGIAFGGYPYAVSKRVKCVTKCGGAAMRALSLKSELQSPLLWGHNTSVSVACAEMERCRNA